jgi:hypothetical protein
MLLHHLKQIEALAIASDTTTSANTSNETAPV